MQDKTLRKKKKNDIFFIIIIVVTCFFAFNLLKGNAPAIFGYRILHVISGSMEPKIENGSYIIVKEVNPGTLKEGDVITFISEEPAIYGLYNTHRIYDICKDTYTGETLFITKGDAHAEPDSYPVEAEQIVGKLVKVVPFGKSIGKLMTRLSNNHVYLGIIIIPLFICLVSYIIQLFKALSEKDEEE